MKFSEVMSHVGDCVWSSINGHGRGDGYDVQVFQLGARYLVSVDEVGGSYISYYVAATLEDAKAVGAGGYTPGSAPGRYRYVRDVARLKEIAGYTVPELTVKA